MMYSSSPVSGYSDFEAWKNVIHLPDCFDFRISLMIQDPNTRLLDCFKIRTYFCPDFGGYLTLCFEIWILGIRIFYMIQYPDILYPDTWYSDTW